MLQSWSARHKTPLYVLKKDQQKGFDFLSLQSFYDAVDFYGLPTSLRDFDIASQQDVPCCVLPAHGLTNSIAISGVNRQGDNRALIRFTISTAMCSWYLDERAKYFDQHSGLSTSVLMETHQCKIKAPHTPVDKDSNVRITTVEMMDDSLLIARSLPAVTILHEEQEKFHFTYGAITAVGPDKTCLCILNEPNSTLTTASINMRKVKEIRVVRMGIWEILWEKMDIPISTELKFLKTDIDNQKAMFDNMTSIIKGFTLPASPIRLPITATRRVISQLLIPKISQKLRLQPISRHQASQLDMRIADMIHDYYGWTSRVAADILMLPIEDHGFGFPSLADINATVAIKGLHRDLNYKVREIRVLAEITLQDWTCQGNK
jgi:hypothetical protein